MDNKISREAIERFFKNQCDVQEAGRVADYLKNIPQEVLNRYLSDREWQDHDSALDKHLPEGLRHEMWADLAEKTALYKNRKVTYLKRVLAAACMIGVLLTGYYFYSLRADTALKQEKAAIVKITKENTSKADQNVELPDGTTLILKPGASVYYYTSFNSKREVFVAGTAFFNVIHDSTHPFVAVSNGIAIKDIGTRFWIENKEAAQTLTVKLEEGLVRVHSMEKSFRMRDVYLKPGQKLLINKLTGTAIVDAVKKRENPSATSSAGVQKEVPAGKTTWTNAAYTFSKTSLEEVFKKLEIRYKVTIMVEDPDINKRQFTGKVMYTDSLASLINVICAINNLSYTSRGDTLYIKK